MISWCFMRCAAGRLHICTGHWIWPAASEQLSDLRLSAVDGNLAAEIHQPRAFASEPRPETNTNGHMQPADAGRAAALVLDVTHGRVGVVWVIEANSTGRDSCVNMFGDHVETVPSLAGWSSCRRRGC